MGESTQDFEAPFPGRGELNLIAHIAFGNNQDFPGGQNKSKTHVDFLFLKPTISVTYLDGSSLVIIKDGALQI